MSGEVCEHHKEDNRYVYCLEKMGEWLDHKFEYELIQDKDLFEVHDYNRFYDKFRNYLRDIGENTEPGDIIYVNVTSGTAAMQSALHVMAEISEEKIIPVQVVTPEGRMNSRYENRDSYSAELEWEYNEDNEKDFTNRCTEVKCENLRILIQRNLIRKFTKSYDYKAACIIADDIKLDLSDTCYALLKAAEARLQLDASTISKYLKDVSYEIIPVRSGNHRNMVEYMLSLEVKIKKGEYADFIRGITPVVVNLFEMILESRCGIKLCDYTYGKDQRKWDMDKLQNDKRIWDILSNSYDYEFKGGLVYSDHLLQLIKGISKDNELIRTADEVRNAESKVRNIAAHDIVSVTDASIKSSTKNLSAKDIFSGLKKLCRYADIPGGKEVWDSYDRMNDLIFKELGQ
ncbi:MAG: hypothetical protein HFE90_05930 [Firmicutes bacterium]|nr:hypothetical protein [Bacillota bacterium]